MLSLRVFLRFVICCILFLAPWVVLAQKKKYQPRVGSSIVDDSTKSVYGPQTSRWTTEEDIFYNRNKYQAIDTSITNYHRWTYVQKSNNFYKDLGNVGTAISPIFPQAPSAIGVSSGFTSFDLFYNSEEIRYFDTKSPYSRMYLVWGSKARSTTRVEFSRNINPRWNFGFNFHPMNIDKQVQRARKGDWQTKNVYYDGYTSFKTKDDKYSILFNFRRIRHRVKENGGINLTGTTLPEGIFDTNANPSLTTAENSDLRTNYHLFHQYQIGSALQIYHTLDRYKQLRQFSNLAADSSYFTINNPNEFGASDTLRDKSKFKYFQNEFGVKGRASNLFYNFYYKIRHYSYSMLRLPDDPTLPTGYYTGTESYLGARTSLEFDSLFVLSGWGEIMPDGNHRLEANLNTPWLDAQLKQLQSKPAFMQNQYYGGHNFWKDKNFSSTQTLNLNAFLKGRFGPLFISPGFNYTLLSNYIFFKENPDVAGQKILPIQSSGNQHVVSPEVRMEVALWKRFFFRPSVIYTRFLENADDALSIPELFVNAQLTFEGFLFKKNLQAQIGFDFHWQSDYYALGYDAPTQQFYIQNTEIMKAYPLADFFINGKIKRGKFFIKYHNIAQVLNSLSKPADPSRIGYIPTPGYPGQRSILDFGFEILLFD